MFNDTKGIFYIFSAPEFFFVSASHSAEPVFRPSITPGEVTECQHLTQGQSHPL